MKTIRWYKDTANFIEHSYSLELPLHKQRAYLTPNDDFFVCNATDTPIIDVNGILWRVLQSDASQSGSEHFPVNAGQSSPIRSDGLANRSTSSGHFSRQAAVGLNPAGCSWPSFQKSAPSTVTV